MEGSKAKEKKLNPNMGTQDRPEKMSYEQLENIAHQLSEQNRQLYMKLQSSNMTNIFKRLDYLFKVVENGHMFSEDFLTKCIKEIEELITVPEDKEEDKQDNNIKPE